MIEMLAKKLSIIGTNEEYEGNRNTKFEPHSGGAIPIQINGQKFFL